MDANESPLRQRLWPLLGWSLSAIWAVVVAWGFWQTEGRPLRERFVATDEAQAQVAQLEAWFRASAGLISAAKGTLIVDVAAACPCDNDETNAKAWTGLQVQGLQVVERRDLQTPPLPQDVSVALIFFSAQGKLLYAGPGVVPHGCGGLSLPALLWQGLRANEPPFGTPIVQSHCDCPSIQV